jgi:hypothetical protein
MAEPQWAPMTSAPRDGTLILVAVRASEQGPEEYDVVRWATSARSGEESWVATDSDPEARFVYAEGELAGWVPLPGQLPKLRARGETTVRVPDPPETDGSAI